MPQNNFFKSALSYEGKVFSYYKRQQAAQKELLSIIKSSLPEHLASHALYCVATDKKISLYTNSATWSSQLRFYHQQICQKLAASNQRHFEVLQIKIIPAEISKKEQPLKIPSQDNISLILDQAQHQSDITLKKALLKLAKTFETLSEKKK